MGRNFAKTRGARKYGSEIRLLRTTFSFAGTVLPHVLERPAFWLGLFAHLAIWAAYYSGAIPGRVEKAPRWAMNWNQVKVITSMTTFFEVFYISHCYRRYSQLHGIVRDLFTDIDLIMLDLRNRVRDDHPPHAWIACRYVMASALLLLHTAHVDSHAPPDAVDGAGSSSEEDSDRTSLGLGGGGARAVLMTTQDEDLGSPGSARLAMAAPQGARLLRPEEEEALCRVDDSHQPLVLLYWSLEALGRAYKAAKAPANAQQAGVQRLMKMHGDVTNLAHQLNLPVPFQYFHLLNLMVMVNVAVLAYIMGTASDLGAPCMFVVCEVAFIGLIELASQLSNPFGNDDVDFPLTDWKAEVVLRARTLMESNFKTTPEAWQPILDSASERLDFGDDVSQLTVGVYGWSATDDSAT